MKFRIVSLSLTMVLCTLGCAQTTTEAQSPEAAADAPTATPATASEEASPKEDVAPTPDTASPTEQTTRTNKPTLELPARCLEPRTAGRCKARFAVFGFDPLKGKCVQYFYGGCEGSENRFETLQACNDACAPHANQDADK